MISRNGSWTKNIKEELSKLGLYYLWEYIEHCNHDVIYNIIQQRINDVYMQNIFSIVTQSSKVELYQYITDGCFMHSYLSKTIDFKYRKEITKIRISNHKLNIEVGRYKNVVRPLIVCTLCDQNDIEDEFHFILKCVFYSDLRKMYIKMYYYQKPSMFKLVNLLRIQNVKELCNLGKFLTKATLTRNSAMID